MAAVDQSDQAFIWLNSPRPWFWSWSFRCYDSNKTDTLELYGRNNFATTARIFGNLLSWHVPDMRVNDMRLEQLK